MNKNIFLLAATLTLLVSGNLLNYSVSALAAKSLTGATELATLPIFLALVTSTICTFPLSHLMARLGRILGFQLAAFLGLIAGIINSMAMAYHSFALLLVGGIILGIGYAAVPFYRFAALEAAEPGHGDRALGYVMLGGVGAAIFGPFLADHLKEAMAISFQGCFVGYAVLHAGIILLLSGVKPRTAKAAAQDQHRKGRSTVDLLSDRAVLLSMLSAIIANGLMVFLMMALPLAMSDEGITFSRLTLAVQWHMLGMYAPGIISGPLIERLGKMQVLFLGGLFNLGSLGFAMMGLGFWGYFTAMLLLGLGWNFMFLASTSLFAASLQPGEEAKGQGLSELLNMAIGSLASLGAAFAYQAFGFAGIALGCLPVLLGTLWMAAQVGRSLTQLSPAGVELD